MTDPVPAEAAALVPVALAAAEADLAPVGPQGVGVMLDGFCALVPVPMARDPQDQRAQVVDPAFIRALMVRLKDKPAAVVQAALDRVVDTHKWETPVKVAQVVEAVDAEMGQRMAELRKLKSADLRLRMDGARALPPPSGPKLYRQKTPEQQAEFDRLAAQVRNLGGGVPLFDDERMSPAEKERVRAASLRRTAEDGEAEHV